LWQNTITKPITPRVLRKSRSVNMSNINPAQLQQSMDFKNPKREPPKTIKKKTPAQRPKSLGYKPKAG